MVDRSRFCSLSSNMCHTDGKGEGMRWRMRTPDGEAQGEDPTRQSYTIYGIVSVIAVLLDVCTSV